MMIFYVWDKKYERWALQWGQKDKCRSLNQYLREKWFKKLNLMWCDLEGFMIDQDGTLYLADECGGMAYMPSERFVVSFDKEAFAKMPDSKPNGNFKLLTPQQPLK